MMLVLGIILISLELVIGSEVYWRDYTGSIPSDAFVDTETGLSVAKIFSTKYSGIHPTVLSSTGSTIKYEAEKITDNIKVLCSDDLTKFYWAWTTAAIVRSPTTHKVVVFQFDEADEATITREFKKKSEYDLVEGGFDKSGYKYIAKMFIKGHWYLGEIDGDYCYFYNVPDCGSHRVSYYNWCTTVDCMVLKYK